MSSKHVCRICIIYVSKWAGPLPLHTDQEPEQQQEQELPGITLENKVSSFMDANDAVSRAERV